MDPSTKGREDNSPSSRPVHTQAARDENVSGSAELSHEFSYGTFVGDSPVVTGSRAMMYQDNSQIVDEGEMFQGICKTILLALVFKAEGTAQGTRHSHSVPRSKTSFGDLTSRRIPTLQLKTDPTFAP